MTKNNQKLRQKQKDNLKQRPKQVAHIQFQKAHAKNQQQRKQQRCRQQKQTLSNQQLQKITQLIKQLGTKDMSPLLTTQPIKRCSRNAGMWARPKQQLGLSIRKQNMSSMRCRHPWLGQLKLVQLKCGKGFGEKKRRCCFLKKLFLCC